MRLQKHLAKLDGHLRAANLPKKTAKRYRNAAERILGRMTETALGLVEQNVLSYYFYPNQEAVAEAGNEPDSLGFYQPHNGSLHLNGGAEGGDSIHRIYAHEYTHALDGPDDEISGSQEWQQAWQEEIVEGAAFGEVGADSPHEGLAQLGEYMLRDKRDEASELCPKCVALWEGQGL